MQKFFSDTTAQFRGHQ